MQRTYKSRFCETVVDVLLVATLGFVFVSIVAFSGCRSHCIIDATRCFGSEVQVCNSSEAWEREMDCSQIEPVELEWTCCLDPLDMVYSCLPEGECAISYDAGDGGDAGI